MTKIDEDFRELSNVKTFISETIIKVFREKEAAEKRKKLQQLFKFKEKMKKKLPIIDDERLVELEKNQCYRSLGKKW